MYTLSLRSKHSYSESSDTNTKKLYKDLEKQSEVGHVSLTVRSRTLFAFGFLVITAGLIIAGLI